MKSPGLKLGLALMALVIAQPALGAAAGVAVVKYAKGNIRATGAEGGPRDLQPSDLVPMGISLESGQDGKAVLRFLADQAFLELRPRTVLTLKKGKLAGKKTRKVLVQSGIAVLGVKRKGEGFQCENTHTLATALSARFSCSSDEKSVATMIVQDGELSVYNRPKDLTATVRSGQKAISDLNGIRISDATDSELEQVGFRQNTLEVDFLNPQTEEFTTLEVEYETQF